MTTNTPQLFYGNVQNTRLIANLPEGCCVEVPVVADANGLRPCHVGDLPPELAAHCSPHVFVQDLAVRAALDGDRERVYRAAMLDRHAASVLSLKEIRGMVDELIEAHGDAMPAGIRRGSNRPAAHA
jgi:alpha-galactosidase